MFEEMRGFLTAREALLKAANGIERFGEDGEYGRIIGRLREMEKELMKLAREFEDHQE